ncbi:hypothetical protein K493DRAFT_341920 [Basidiobolus meristosporus CBS 931.73]|uniref:P-loop containing nucleoside triphosphate hydrolase protein n=1 Tax=Basidiobolus meristosporus CBS 931.73 TaxID=1314790 RepID=A0A1Y1XF31_9FUNG|nr:hypothetical protein K493DRAFT_341920 [Basidiobolus meristosporus CBS 931.73]|eukprot:ORX84358.1 hypothetical protein K493DRAFT_341920 [Basidiobolus meristosporus CBS 931.73]
MRRDYFSNTKDSNKGTPLLLERRIPRSPSDQTLYGSSNARGKEEASRGNGRSYRGDRNFGKRGDPSTGFGRNDRKADDRSKGNASLVVEPEIVINKGPSVKFLTDRGKIQQDLILKSLLDLPGHLVIGVIGPEGAGKSTILNGFLPHGEVFPTRTLDTQMKLGHETHGIDMYTTPERIILLDVQPFSSMSILESAIQGGLVPDSVSPEVWLETQDVQIGTYLMSVCDILIVVSDGVADLGLWKFVRTLEMLKYKIPEYPSINAKQAQAKNEGEAEYYPEIVFVGNKIHKEEWSQELYEKVCLLHRVVFAKSNMRMYSNVTMQKSPYPFETSLASTPNIVLLPYEAARDVARAYVEPPISIETQEFAGALKSLRNMVIGLPRKGSKRGQVGEKEWLRSAVKIWDLLKRSDMLAEYNEILRKTRALEKEFSS